MRLKTEWQQSVAPKQAYLAILLTALLLSGMGIYFLQTGTLPQFSPLFWALALLWGGIFHLVAFARYGKHAFPTARLAFLLGWVLFAGGQLLKPFVPLLSGVDTFGTILLLLSLFSQRFDFSKVTTAITGLERQDKLTLSFLIAFISSIVFVCLAMFACMFGTWPILRVSHLTAITEISFPTHTQLVSGYDHRMGPSEIAVAKLRMSHEDAHKLLSHTKMSTISRGPGPVGIPSEFSHRGWDLSTVKNLRSTFFSNGSYTQVWVDDDDPRVSTVYLYYDEP